MNPRLYKLSIIGLLTLAINVALRSDGQGQNLISNAEFEEGNTGFYSDYTYSQWDMLPASTYSLIPDPHWAHGGATHYGDHTTGSGNMLMFNGSANASDTVWGTLAPLSIETNTDYYFEAWISKWLPYGDASYLTFQAKDEFGSWVDLGVLDTSTIPTAEWVSISTVWNSGNAATTELRLINDETASYGNDFAIDSLNFSKVNNVPEAAGVLFFGITGVAAILRRRRWD